MVGGGLVGVFSQSETQIIWTICGRLAKLGLGLCKVQK